MWSTCYSQCFVDCFQSCWEKVDQSQRSAWYTGGNVQFTRKFPPLLTTHMALRWDHSAAGKLLHVHTQNLQTSIACSCKFAPHPLVSCTNCTLFKYWLKCAQVCIKELGVGSCVGELAIEGTREAPYTITTSSIVRVGHVSITDLAGEAIPLYMYMTRISDDCIPSSHLVLEVANNLSPAKKYSITIPSQVWLQCVHN